jgi:hypothetical protein
MAALKICGDYIQLKDLFNLLAFLLLSATIGLSIYFASAQENVDFLTALEKGGDQSTVSYVIPEVMDADGQVLAKSLDADTLKKGTWELNLAKWNSNPKEVMTNIRLGDEWLNDDANYDATVEKFNALRDAHKIKLIAGVNADTSNFYTQLIKKSATTEENSFQVYCNT